MDSVEDALFLQARGIVGAEFEEWMGKLTSLLQSSDRGPACLTLLRQMYVITGATKSRQNFSPEVYQLLMSIVLEPEQGTVKVKLIAAGILQELSPSKHIRVPDFSPPVARDSIPYVLPVILSQTNAREKLSQLMPSVVKWLTSPGQEEELSLAALCTLHGLCTHPRVLDGVEVEQLHGISLQVASWLKQACKSTLPAPTTGISFFGSGAKKQLFPVKEIDGTPSQGTFTILNLGGHYSADQLLNVGAFSILRRWLLTTITRGGVAAPSTSPGSSVSATPTSDHQEARSGSLSSLPLTSSLPPTLPSTMVPGPSPSGGTTSLTASLVSLGPGKRSRQGLKEAALQYCSRVIEQCERQPMKSEDAQLIESCLCECVSVLDLLCTLSTSLVHTVFPKVRILHSRVTQDPVSNARLLLVLLKFFVNHGESESYDLDSLMDLFFGKVLAIKFTDPALAYEVVTYLVDNLEKLHASTSIFTKFFPSILKILAWFPITFVAEFLQLLPAFVSENTASEVLHSILDLPCLAATLQTQHILLVAPNALEVSINPPYAKSLAAFQDATYKFMFGHFLRSENGKGDTIDKLASLHHLLLDFVEHERVIAVANIAPLMMKVFFKTVVGGGNDKVTMQLAGLLLERAVLIYNLEPFSVQAREVIAKQLLAIFKLHPHLVVDQRRELLEYLDNLRTLTTGGELCYMHLVWLIGEYSQVRYDSRCSTALLNQFFGTLESVAYEISITFGKNSRITVRLVMVLMSTLAKLASRCQILIPRALLCLNKIVQQISEHHDTDRVLLNRANELVNVLKIPSLASAVLSPHHHGNEETKRQTNITHLLQVTANHLNIK